MFPGPKSNPRRLVVCCALLKPLHVTADALTFMRVLCLPPGFHYVRRMLMISTAGCSATFDNGNYRKLEGLSDSVKEQSSTNSQKAHATTASRHHNSPTHTASLHNHCSYSPYPIPMQYHDINNSTAHDQEFSSHTSSIRFLSTARYQH